MRRPSQEPASAPNRGHNCSQSLLPNGRRARVPPPRCHRQHSPKVFKREMSSRVVSNVDALVDGQGQ